MTRKFSQVCTIMGCLGFSEALFFCAQSGDKRLPARIATQASVSNVDLPNLRVELEVALCQPEARHRFR